MKGKWEETEVKVNCSPFVSFSFLVLEVISGKKKDTCRKQAKVKEYTNHLLASEPAFQDPVDQESGHY